MAADADVYVLLDALFANAPVGLAFWDAELRYRRINPALAAINGIAPEAHIGRRPRELLGPMGEQAEAVLEAVLADRRPRVAVPFEGATPALPGDVRQFSASFYPVVDAAGTLLGAGAVVVETTGEVAAQRAQRTSSALLDAIFRAAPVGIAFWDRELRYRRVNPALAQMNGIPAEEHLGRSPEEVLGPAGRELGALLRRIVEAGEETVEAELEVRRRDGTLAFRQATAFRVLDAQGQVAGVAGVLRDVTEEHTTEVERGRLLRDAFAARSAAEAAQLRAEAAQADSEAARRRADVLARAGERLAMVIRDYERTLQEVAAVTVPAIADRCTFTLRDPRGGVRTVAVAPDADDPGEVPDVVREVLATGTPRMRDGVMTVPLPSRGGTLGALHLERRGRSFDGDDLRMVELLAVRAALSVENARLYAERSHIAQTLQRSLLPPKLPEVPGLELAARYRPAGEENEVGGDFYDAFGSGDGVWTVIIGDVSGKGAEAAALTSLSRHTLRAASLRTSEPIESLELHNEALWSQADPLGRFCTTLYAQVRPAEGGADVRLATGGHLPPVILRAGGRVEHVQVRGTLVGGLQAPTFGERHVRLDPGDLLLLYTDGVVELRSAADAVASGTDALDAVLREHRGAPAEEIVAAVEERAVALQDGEPRDDIALVAVRPRA
jgi:PAS domain S-box-containing protein